MGELGPSEWQDDGAIAILGVACRFGGDASDEQRLWELLCDGRSAKEPRTRGGSNAKEAYHLRQDPYAFDADFFGISHREARAMDPNHRMLLEVTYEALEQAGLTMDAVAGSNTSCYVGQFTDDYGHMLSRDIHGAPMYTATGSNSAISASRISSFFNFQGPSYTLNTACSSGMVALHAACESIRHEGAGMAVAASSNLILTGDMATALDSLNFLSPDGTCKTFDTSANGYARGEGVTSLILRPVRAAIDAGEPIRAIIRGTGVNHNGRGERPGITVPSVGAQATLIAKTYESAGLDYSDTNFVEAHGTGTKIGDPVEMEAIGKTIGQGRNSPLLVGSSKPNLGHTEASAGLAGIIKGVRILEHSEIPPNIHLNQPNPVIKFDDWNLEVPRRLTKWQTAGLRRLSVCSTGYGGVNAHVILDDAKHYLEERGLAFLTPARLPGSSMSGKSSTTQSQDALTGTRLFMLRAQDRDGPRRQAKSLKSWLSRLRTGSHDSARLICDLSHTLKNQRSPLSWISPVAARSFTELEDELSLTDNIDSRAQQSLPTTPAVCMVFTGQGAQWPEMGTQLYQQSSIFRSSVDTANHHLRQQLRCSWSAVDELRRPQASSQVHKPELSQALCTIIQVALVDLLAYWRLTPKYVIGHSSGEIAGAYCLGALSREAAWEIAYFRGQLAASLDGGQDPNDSTGGMLAVGTTPEEATSVIADADVAEKVVIACYNSPQNVTLSGDTSALDQLERILSEKGTFARRLKVGVAYHSHHMESVAAAYFRKLRRIRPSSQTEGDVSMFSTVTGGIIQSAGLGAKYFVDNLLNPVKFAPAVKGILEHAQTSAGSQSELVFVEVGPHSALKAPLKQTVEQAGVGKLRYTPLMVRGEDSAKSLLYGAGFVHALGVPFDLSDVSLNPEEGIASPRTLTDLPSYQWNHSTSFKGFSRYVEQHERYSHKMGALIGTRTPTLTEGHHVWRRYLEPSSMPWLFEHCIDGAALYPAAAHIIAVLEAATELVSREKKIESFSLREIAFHAPILIPEEESIEMSVEIRPRQTATRERSHATWMAFTICSCREGSDLQVNCTGLVMANYEAAVDSAVARERAEYQQREKDAHKINAAGCRDEVSGDEFYAGLRSVAVDYGKRFQMLSDIRRKPGKSSFKAHRQTWETSDHVLIHPGTLDSIIHSIFAACTGPDLSLKGPMVPSLIADMHVSAAVCTHGTEGEYFGSSTVERRGFLGLEGEVAVFDCGSQDLSVRVSGMRMQRTGAARSTDRDHEAPRELCCSLTWEPLEEAGPTIETGAHFCIVCPAHPSPHLQNVADSIHAELREHGHHCIERPWPLSSPTSRSERCIFLVDLDSSLLYDCSADHFRALQRSLSELSHVLWVSPNTTSAGIPTGLARTLRNEMPSLSIRTLQVSEQSLSEASKLGGSIARVACADTPEMEFCEAEDGLHVPRYLPDSAMDKRISDIQRNAESVVQRPLSRADRGAVLTVQQPGDLSTLSFSPGARSDNQALGADEVDAEVHATGLNFRDLMVAIGAMPDLLMGFDASGVVTAVGSEVENVKVGDRVCVLFHGAHRSLIRSPSALVQRIPESMSFKSASTLPLVLVTVYNALIRVARAEAGQTVVIHAGAGGVGQAAIQLAQHLGLHIFTTVGSAAKRELLRTKYGLKDGQILASRDHSFAGAIDRLTDDRGVDIILNQLAGELQSESWNCIAPGGTFVELGLKDIQSNASLEMRPFARDATFTFFNVARMIKEEPRVTGRLMAEAFELLRQGVFRPVEPLTTFPIHAVEEAFRTVQSGKHVGKSALVWEPEAKLPMILSVRDATRLRPDATYVLAGGLGAVGRSVAHLLADMCARHLCFLSRSGGESQQAQTILDELRERDLEVSAYGADVADAESLSHALAQIRANHPPIRGILQLAMVLRDGVFEAASHTQWTESLRPKVQGSRNLDDAFPESEEEEKSLDFFILLSSFGGIFGSPTQSNYAAGCAYQDALAHERRARGCKNSVSIDLGIMRGVGYFEQEQRTTGHLKQWEEPFGLDESELHALVRLAVGGETEAQVVTGLPTARKAREVGVERPFFLEDPRFAHLAAEDGSPSAGSAGITATESKSLQHDLAHAPTLPAARDLLTTALLARVATSLQISADAIQLSQPLHAYGVDSLVAVEIRSWIAKEVGVEVSTWELTGEGSLGGLVERLVGGCPFVTVKE